ncbi:MAG: YceD family protein [Pseudomonadota bacterium]
MSGRLPKFIEPLRLARDGGHLQGQLPLHGMTRLAESVEAVQGEARIDLQFGVDEAGVRTLQGTIQAEVQQICQRCMAPMTVTLNAEVSIGIVRSPEEAQELPELLEPMILETADPISLADLAEDELILALPIAPMHGAGEKCVGLDEYRSDEKATVVEKPNPFAVLAGLKKKH